MVLLTAAVNAAPSLLLFRASNDLFESWEVTRFYPAENHLPRGSQTARQVAFCGVEAGHLPAFKEVVGGSEEQEAWCRIYGGGK